MWSSVLSLAMLSSFWGHVHLINVYVPDTFLNVTSGKSVLLRCTFTTTASTLNLNIQWNFISRTTMTTKQVSTSCRFKPLDFCKSRRSFEIYYYQAGTVIVYPDYAGRVIVPPTPSTSMNASITIEGVTSADSGDYTCQIHNVPDNVGSMQGTITLEVLEKPSRPFCGIHGTVESGHLVTLTCHSEHANPAPTYHWSRLELGQAAGTRAVTNIQTGVLRFGNLSQFEFGQYQCNASNSAGFAICTITIHEARSDGAIAGAVVGAVILACLVVFVIWCIVHSLRKKKRKAHIEMESKPLNASSANCYTAAENNSQVPTKEYSSQKQEEEPMA